jgi:hypothetical protein
MAKGKRRRKAELKRSLLQGPLPCQEVRQAGNDRDPESMLDNHEGRRMSWYEVINSLARFYADTAAAFENNSPELCIVVGNTETPLARVVRDELVRAIFHWPHWQLLLQNAANGYIQPPSSGARTSRRVTTPTRSDDFLRPFEQCVRELDKFTRLKAGEAIDGLLRTLAEQINPQREGLEVFCREPTVRQQLKERVGADYADLVDVLYEAADPLQLGEKLRASCLNTDRAKESSEDFDNEPRAIPALDPLVIFPLPIRHKFGWNEEVWKELSPDQRSDHTHQSWVPRIRDTLLSSAEEALFGLVGEISSRAVSNLRNECNELSFLLQNEIVARNEGFIVALEQVLSKKVESPVICSVAA